MATAVFWAREIPSPAEIQPRVSSVTLLRISSGAGGRDRDVRADRSGAVRPESASRQVSEVVAAMVSSISCTGLPLPHAAKMPRSRLMRLNRLMWLTRRAAGHGGVVPCRGAVPCHGAVSWLPVPSIALLLLLAACLGGCKPVLAPETFAAGTPEMRPEIFFAGATSSSGLLENFAGAPTARFHVEGSGQALPDGGFRLDQTITFDQEPPRTRTWLLRRLDEHRYTGSLTDARGPVTAEAFGDLLHLSYPMQTPFAGWMEQWLYLQPDGRTVVNEATVRVLGVLVARLSERITRDGR
jgi:hypothetical protein